MTVSITRNKLFKPFQQLLMNPSQFQNQYLPGVASIDRKKDVGFHHEDPDARSIKPKAVRKLDSLSTAIIRLIFDCTLYLNSLTNNDIKNLFKNAQYNDSKSTIKYFLDHVNKDIEVLSNCLQYSFDDSLVLFHFMLNKIFDITIATGYEYTKFETVESIEKFETEFRKHIIVAILDHQTDKIIKTRITELVRCESKNNCDQVFQMVHEINDFDVSTKEIPTDEESLENNEKYWKYSIPITIDHAKNTFNLTKKFHAKYELLDEFFNQMNQLQLIKYLPAINKMIFLLITRLNRQIYKKQAKEMSMRDVLNDGTIIKADKYEHNIVNEGINAFIEVWNSLRSLDTNNNLPNIELNYKNLRLFHLLPSNKDSNGYINHVIENLIKIQNDFLNFYAKLKNDVIINEIELYNLLKNNHYCIEINIESDILKIIQINSSYSLREISDNTDAIGDCYNFMSIQAAVEEKLYGKAIIVGKIPTFEYLEDLDNGEYFTKIKIQQIEIPLSLKEKIISCYTQPNQLTNIIRNLRAIIDFVISTSLDDNNITIFDYADNVLTMNVRDELTQCRHLNNLKMEHLRSLWILLNFTRAILLTDHHQDPFDELDDSFKKEKNLEEAIINSLKQTKSVVYGRSISRNDYDENSFESLAAIDAKADFCKHDKDLIDYICGKKYTLNTSNLKMLLENLYKYIIFVLIPSFKHKPPSIINKIETIEYASSRASTPTSPDDVHVEYINPEYELKCIFDHFIFKTNHLTDEFKNEMKYDYLKDYNFDHFNMEHIYHMWKLLVKVLHEQTEKQLNLSKLKYD